MKVPSRKQAEECFCALDVNGDGVVSPIELQKLFKDSGFCDDDIILMFSDIDKNQDRMITKEELLEEVLKNPREQSIKEIFQNCDCDADGKLSHDECTRMGQEAGVSDTEAFEKCWEALDQDGSGTVSQEEFMAYMNGNY